jgi:hypothetical protein
MRRANSLIRLISLSPAESNLLATRSSLLCNGSTIKRYVNYDCFADRHIGPSELEKQQMLHYLGFKVSFLMHLTLK